MVIGLTGQTGAGKTSAGEIFKENGFFVIDADVVARRVVEPGAPCLIAISQAFGEDMIASEGELDRKRLAAVAFGDKRQLEKLNRVTHPYIIQRIEQMLRTIDNQWVLLDAAALFESGADKFCDETVAVIAKAEIRRGRIMRRDELTEKQADDRISSQNDDQFYIKRCNHIIISDGSFEDLRKAVVDVIQKIKNKEIRR